MRTYITSLFLLLSATGWAQPDSALTGVHSYPAYVRHSTIATISVGFADGYRNNYSLPAGFQKSNTSGFVPVYAKLEYGLYEHISVAATFSYDAFVYNYKQSYVGNNGPFTRYKTNNARIFSGGVTAFYHILHIKRLDPFVGVGLALNNIRYSAYPQGDSTLIKKDHTVTPYLKAGVRYYISNQFSLFADAGYDKQSIVSVGFSCRFFGKKK